MTLPNDGDTADASDVNVPFNTIANVINGGLDSTNITDGGLTPADLTSGTGSSWAWQTWTPTFTGMTGGTLNYSKYIQVGKTVFYRWKYTLAGAGISASVTFTLPVTANADYSQDIDMGNANYVDSGTQLYKGTVTVSSVTVAFLRAMLVSGANIVASSTLSSTVPFTWGSADYIIVTGSYEAA